MHNYLHPFQTSMQIDTARMWKMHYIK